MSHQNSDRLFVVFYIKTSKINAQDYRRQNYIKLIRIYKAILNRKKNTASKISNIQSVQLIVDLLKVIIM